MGKHRHTAASGVGSRLVPSLIAAGLIIVAAFGIGILAGVVLPEPTHRVAAPVTTDTSEPSAAVDVPTLALTPQPSAMRGTSDVAPVPTATVPTAPPASPEPSATSTPPAPTSASPAPTPVSGHAKRHGRPWPKPTRR